MMRHRPAEETEPVTSTVDHADIRGRRGVGRALLQEVFSWARERGLSRLGLWAPAHSPAAISLYRQAGFRETGNRRPLPTNPSLQILEMESHL
jgi:ribosomal protein S18 acetylase RimI-like enzyme